MKKITTGVEGRKRLITGIKKMSDAVGSTLGPMGRTVIIESMDHTRGLTVTKDGVTVAKSIDLKNPIENLAVMMLKQAASNTASDSGDGTSTSVVIADAMLTAGMEVLKDGADVTTTLREVKRVTDLIATKLKENATPMSDELLGAVAGISANNDAKIGGIIADVFKDMGPDGIVTVENSMTSETYFDTTKGLKIDRGYMSPGFVNDAERDECVMENVHILMSDMELTAFGPLTKLFEEVVKNGLSLLIIAPCSVGFLNTLVANKMKGALKGICAIQPPHFGERMKDLMSDIALATGGVFYSENSGDNLHGVTIEDLGRAERIVVSREATIMKLSEETSDDVAQRVEQLKASVDPFAKKRVATLLGKMGVIYVGGDSDIEQKEMYDRVDDAVCAVQSALEEGVLPGGGVALIECLRYVNTICDDANAKYILTSGLEAPMSKILSNGGIEYDSVEVSKRSKGWGLDMKSGVVGDMIEMGVIDPAKVTRTALVNAMSVATTILGTDAIVTIMRAK